LNGIESTAARNPPRRVRQRSGVVGLTAGDEVTVARSCAGVASAPYLPAPRPAAGRRAGYQPFQLVPSRSDPVQWSAPSGRWPLLALSPAGRRRHQAPRHFKKKYRRTRPDSAVTESIGTRNGQHAADPASKKAETSSEMWRGDETPLGPARSPPPPPMPPRRHRPDITGVRPAAWTRST